jgi:hypothetical protein
MPTATSPADERERLLRQSVTDEVVFTGPNEEDKGFRKLLEHIERRNLISNRFRTFLEGTKPFFVRFQECVRARRKKRNQPICDSSVMTRQPSGLGSISQA